MQLKIARNGSLTDHSAPITLSLSKKHEEQIKSTTNLNVCSTVMRDVKQEMMEHLCRPKCRACCPQLLLTDSVKESRRVVILLVEQMACNRKILALSALRLVHVEEETLTMLTMLAMFTSWNE